MKKTRIPNVGKDHSDPVPLFLKIVSTVSKGRIKLNRKSKIGELFQDLTIFGPLEYMDERKFEGLVATVLKRAGATSTNIIPRQSDKGVDIVATFQIGGIMPLEVGIQAKYYKGNVAQAAVDQLVKGLKAEGLSTGWLVTSGEIPDELGSYLENAPSCEELDLATVDGRLLAEMIIDFGLQDSV
jgi:predicted helicase